MELALSNPLEVSKKKYSTSTKWVASLSSVAMSAFGGVILGGIPGTLLGLTTSAFDEYLIYQNKITRHYLSESTFWSLATLMPAASVLSHILHPESSSLHAVYQIAALVAGIAIPHFSCDFLDYRDKLEIPLTSFETINQLFDRKETFSFKELKKIKKDLSENFSKGFERVKEDIKELYQNPFLCVTVQNMGYNFLNTLLSHTVYWHLGRYAGDLFISTLLDQEKLVFNEVIKKAFLILGIFFLRDTLDYVIEIKKQSSTMQAYEKIIIQFSKILLDKENSQKVLADDNAKEAIFQMPIDLFDLLYMGVYNLNPVVNDSLSFLISLEKLVMLSAKDTSPLYNLSPLIHFAPYLISMLPGQAFLKSMTKEGQKIHEEYRKVQNQAWMNRYDVINNLTQINLRDAENFAENKFCTDLEKEYELDIKGNKIKSQENYYKNIQAIANHALDLGYLGSWTLLKNLSIGEVYQLKKIITELSDFFCSGLQYQMDNKSLLTSKNRITHFFNVINSKTQNFLRRTQNGDGKIIFKDYQLNLGDEKLIYIDYFEFLPQKRYAITGKSGCGKSSILTDLKMGLNKALSSKGEISFGSKKGGMPHMMFIDQNLYLPKETFLLEVIYFPRLLNELSAPQLEELKKSVLKFFEELDIDKFSNGDKEEPKEALSSKLNSKNFKLSGGQSKKIAIIQAILMKPDILVMDETFTGLDQNSLIKVQEVIKKYLPETMVITVDHHAKENNHNQFYDSVILFDEKGLVETSL